MRSAFLEILRNSSRKTAGPQTGINQLLILNPNQLLMKTRHALLSAGLLFAASAAVSLAAPASENWENHCAKCHGEDGKGQTKVGKKLKLKDYTDAAVQAEMTDEMIVKAITEGIKDAAGKETMKPFKDELSADEIKDFIAYIRQFKA